MCLAITEYYFYESFHSEAFESRKRLLIIQCRAGSKHNHLISYARYRVPLLQETVTHKKDPNSYVVFVTHIPRRHIDTSVVGLQGGQWLSAHIDDLRESNIAPYVAMENTLVIYSVTLNPSLLVNPFHLHHFISDYIAAFRQLHHAFMNLKSNHQPDHYRGLTSC